MKWETIIGLEVHAQLKTKTKLFCRCSNLFGSEANTHICPVCLGMPGSLPVLNEKAVALAAKAGIALHCKIKNESHFARKNYFYPDLPKGYQISQFDEPLCTDGYLEIEVQGNRKRIRIERAHMEEDAGKLLHGDNLQNLGGTLVDLNRAGVPLLEIVSAPDLRSSDEAASYMKKLRSILRYIDACDGNMEEGSLRCDANVSVRRCGQVEFGQKVEIKNMNSFKNVQKAIDFEVERQIQILESGESVEQETRLWNPDRGVTISMRSKEEAHDYRYFPEPDLLPLVLLETKIASLQDELPELPEEKIERWKRDYQLPAYDAEVLASERDVALYFEQTLELLPHNEDVAEKSKFLSNFIMSEVMRVANERNENFSTLKLNPEMLAELLTLILQGTISGKIAKEIVDEVVETGRKPSAIVEKKGLQQVSDPKALIEIIEKIILDHPEQVAQYKGGKDKLFGFFVGQVMKVSKGKANPGLLNTLLKEKLDS